VDAIQALTTRKSAKRLVEPAPSDEHLAVVLRAASKAPDHGRMRPWRFIVIRGDARARLGDVLAAAAHARSPDMTEAGLAREREKVLRAPMIIVMAATAEPVNPKIPLIERILSAGAAAQNLFVALHALGYGAMWKTGEPAYDPRVKKALGLADSDHIVGFMYAGTLAAPLGEVDVPDLGALVSEWTGS
jgi:nitroreductase